ncbi:MAG: hemagglutinin repeat-containing protein, partial [Phyllobacterium sp.]
LRQTVREDRLTGSQRAESMIHAGRDLLVDATELNNFYSAIEAGGNAALKGSALNNEGVALHRTTLTKCEANGGCKAYDADGKRNAVNDLGDGVSRLTGDVAIGGLPATIRAAGNLDIGGFAVVNDRSAPGSIAGAAKLIASSMPADPLAAFNGLTAGKALFTPNAAFASLQIGAGPSLGSGPVASDPGALAEALRLNGAALAKLAKPNSGGFGGTVPGQIFLFETRAAFLDVGTFYGSGYFINRIGYKPDREIAFLGDAYFENQLIDQQLRQLVGQGLGKGSFIPGSDAIQQMKLLLDNGLEYAKAHELKIGEQLSPDQIARLTQPLVLYEKRKVQGIEVLAPVIHIPASDKAKLTIAGALISGGAITMHVGTVDNSGVIAARTDLKLAGSNIRADGGSFVAGDTLQLKSAGVLTLKAQSLTLGGTKVINPNGGVEAGGNVLLSARENLTLQGVKIGAGGNADLTGKNIILDVARVANKGTEDVAGTRVTAGGNLGIQAGDDVNLIGSSAVAGGALGITATHGSVNVVTADVTKNVNGRAEKHASQTQATVQKQSELSSGTGTMIKAGEDILLSGSKLNAGGDVRLNAGDDIDITTAQNQKTLKGGQISASTVTHTGSEVTAGGSIVVNAGNDKAGDHDVSIIGSKLHADEKIQLKAADDITIAEAQNTSVVDTKTSSHHLFSSKKSTTHTETSTAMG